MVSIYRHKQDRNDSQTGIPVHPRAISRVMKHVRGEAHKSLPIQKLTTPCALMQKSG